jgi:hypothetical protein
MINLMRKIVAYSVISSIVLAIIITGFIYLLAYTFGLININLKRDVLIFLPASIVVGIFNYYFLKMRKKA